MLLLLLFFSSSHGKEEEQDMPFEHLSEFSGKGSGGAEDMDDGRDPAIKLFGATIPVAAAAEVAAIEAADESGVKEAESEPATSLTDEQKDNSKEVTSIEVHNATGVPPDEEKEGAPISSSCFSGSKQDDEKFSIAVEREASNTKSEDSKIEADGSSQENVLKKPDKILPCPRCNSMDTKFCYYNNYNVNQPRHFCKNCQRYWTAGGTMRNVPVGAGRRKSKHSALHRNLVIPSDGLQSAQLDRALPCMPSTTSHSLIGNRAVLKFGQEAPLCESMAAVLNIRDQVPNSDSGSMIHGESKEEPPCVSSATASNCLENGPAKSSVHMQQGGTQVYCNGLTPPPPLQCYPGGSWVYPWSAAWNTVASMETNRIPSENPCRAENGNSILAPWSPTTMMATAPFCAPTLPFPFMPAPFWGFATWPNGAWPVPLVGSNGCISPSSSTSTSGCSGNGSPTLGKHSRDSTLQSEEKANKCLWVPKTLRIDDPEEAAKSSIWSTLGIKPDIGGIFQSKTGNKAPKSDAAQVLHANPAALSRSQSFQEMT